ncbi:MAG: Fe-S cluster assembly protein SufD [Candidatus Kapabacteria bacterium]|nr:Fe-S cluster assembly protein SufD [Candidatus Kapabacteria bacterium]
MSIDAFNDNVRDAFIALTSQLNGHAAGPFQTKRRSGFDSFVAQGIPTTRHEEWKYSNVLPFIGLQFSERTSEHDLITREDVSQVLDGLTKDSGVTVQVLTDELVARDEVVRNALGQTAPVDVHPFVALNTSLANNGLVIRVARGAQIQRPIHIAVVSDARSADVLATPRILVLADEGSIIDVVESHHAVGDKISLDVGVTEISVAENAHVRYHKIIDDTVVLRHIGYTAARVYRNGRFTSHSVSIGGAFVRNDLVVKLADIASETYLYGVSVLNEKDHVDNHTVVDHAVPHCHSEELYKGIYDGASSGVFNGKIFVRPQAQKTTAYQSNHSILLSDKAQINAKPQLEIWADDVKCSHGATSGQLNDEAIFYLRSRGIDADRARALLTYAFIAEVLEHIDHEGLRLYCEGRVAKKLDAEPFAL